MMEETNMKKTSGFTLIELMIVVAIIAIIATIVIPNLLRSRIQSNESAAIGNLRTLTGAQRDYSAAIGLYADSFTQLMDTTNGPSFLLGSWGAGVSKTGYIFKMKGIEDCRCYETTATPSVPGRTGVRYFYSDCSGKIHANIGAPADSTSPLIGSD